MRNSIFKPSTVTLVRVITGQNKMLILNFASNISIDISLEETVIQPMLHMSILFYVGFYFDQTLALFRLSGTLI